MPNMTSGIIFIGLILCQAFQVIDCCNFSPFEDSRCYLELVNGQYIVRGLPQGTHMDFKICVIANGEIHNQNPVHRQECSQALQGYTVYLHLNAVNQSVHQSQSSSSHGTNIGVSASSSASTDSSHSDHHHVCYNNHPVYREIFDEAKHANCHRTYSVFIKLDHLRLSDHYCLSTLVREMAGLKLSYCQCSDSSSHTDYSFIGQHEYHYHCMNIPTYKDILTRYLSHVPYSGVMGPSAKCHTRNQLWQDLLQLRNSEAHYPTCFDDFVRHMKEAFMAYSDPPCGSCQTPAAHSTANHHYDAYIKGDCLSEHTVWSFLMEEHSDHYHGRNREQLIEHMAALYPDGTDDKCVCSKAHDLNYPFLSSEDFRWSFTCRNNFGTFEPSSYQNVINHLFGSHHFTHSTQSCHSHAAVWQELNRIVKSSNYPVHCLETLIHILRDAVQKQGDPCSCHPVASTTRSTVLTTKMTTTTTQQMTATTKQPTTSTTQQATVSTKPTTTKPTTTTAKPTTTTQSTTVPTTRTTFDWVTIKNTSSSTAAVAHTTDCSKIKTIEELAKHQQIFPASNTDCSNHTYESNLIVGLLCPSLPELQKWKSGVKVIESCDILKSYIPVATFTISSHYSSDGLAGVFLGCTDSSIKIATQECGGKFSILELPRHQVHSDTFSHTTSNYHVIMF